MSLQDTIQEMAPVGTALTRLRAVRRERALSMADLRKASGVSISTIADLESGRRTAQPRTMRKLAEALKIEPRQLYEEPK